MADIHDKKTRSFNMSQVKSKNTKPEILIRKFLFSEGFRYKLHDKTLPGKPDLVFPKYKTVLFVNGCFWHGHENCKYSAIPQTRTEWWLNKIASNKRKDIENTLKLQELGWKVINVWGCGLKKGKKESTLTTLLDEFNYLRKNYKTSKGQNVGNK
jgi:DNA mismatch endonuclease (patch repair protein)